MIAQEFEYSSPTQLNDALAQLAAGAKPLAGGMSLIPMMKLRLATPDKVVDIRRLKELNYVRVEGDTVHIGAMLSHHQVESSEALRSACPLLAETAGNIGDVQVRNMGTIGGSVAHADPAADYLATLFALEAQIVVVSASGERILAIGDFIVDPFATALEPGEIVREIRVPKEAAGTKAKYVKMAQPASGFAIVGIAVRVRKAGSNIEFVRVGVTGAAPTAYRAQAVEARLTGTPGSDADVQAAAALAAEGVEISADLNASSEFRKHLTTVQTARALRAALAGRA